MATIKLYSVTRSADNKEWELIPSRLLVVDDIASYLATKTFTTINNVQYIKNNLEISINLDLSQSYAQPKVTTSYKYVSIQNDGELIHYYFVKKVDWRSKSAVRFELVMDVLNTFEENKDYTFKANTTIIREHKPRVKRVGYTIKFNYGSVTGWSGTLNIGDEVFLGTMDSPMVPAYTGILKGFGGHDITITFIGLDMNAFLTWLSAQSGEVYVVKDTSNFKAVNTFYPLIVDNICYRNIDYVPENINPILFQNFDWDIEHKETAVRKDWYLVYTNQNDPDPDLVINPVECYLVPESETGVTTGTISGGVLNANNLENGKYYYTPLDSSHSITLDDGTTLSYTSLRNLVVFFRNDDDTITLTIYRTNLADGYFYIMGTKTYNIRYLTLNNLPQDYNSYSSFQDPFTYINDSWGTESETWTNTSGSNNIDGIETLDKTDPKIIKVIKIPYVPYDFDYVSHKIDIPSSEWQYSEYAGAHYLKLNNLYTDLHATLDISGWDYNPFKNLYLGEINASLNDLRDDDYESKIYHSEFFEPTYLYDSFCMKVQLEKCDMDYYINDLHLDLDTAIHLNFDMTRTINSRFMFSLPEYQCKFNDSNFYNMFTIARNNEEVLYNNAYISYIKTGFNYDVKAKSLQRESNLFNIGASAVSIGASLFFPSAPLKVMGIVGSAVSLATSVKNAIISEQQNSNDLQSKLTQLKNQTMSASGSDDVDLMSIYAKNRVIYHKFTPNPQMKQKILDLFFYAGYNSGRMGLPNHNTRKSFDYLECEAQLECESSIPQECVNELIGCFKNGVTYIHKTSRADKWDFAQKYENWENELV